MNINRELVDLKTELALIKAHVLSKPNHAHFEIWNRKADKIKERIKELEDELKKQ